jgi:predicted CXXCH cytochrome family protein
MKGLKVSLVIMARPVNHRIKRNGISFHSGGVAECGGCHSMHNPISTDNLLIQADSSSTCLFCHQNSADTVANGYHVSTAPNSLGAGQAPLQRNPGGDFGWLKKTYTFTVRGTTTIEDGATHGHNIIAADFGYVVDPVNTASPGGTFQSSTFLRCCRHAWPVQKAF